MLSLLILPVIVLVATAHRALRLYAPSNIFITRVRTALPRWRTAGAALVLSLTLVAVVHVIGDAIEAGAPWAPSWLNLIVLVLAWDAIKLLAAAGSIVVRLAWRRCAVGSRPSRHGTTRRAAARRPRGSRVDMEQLGV
jgi:hypothetical protein